MDKEDLVHIYNGTLFCPNKEWNAICSNMDATRDYHTKLERERQIPYDITYMWNLNFVTNKSAYKTEMDS